MKDGPPKRTKLSVTRVNWSSTVRCGVCRKYGPDREDLYLFSMEYGITTWVCDDCLFLLNSMTQAILNTRYSGHELARKLEEASERLEPSSD